jgi:hypothetical protein
MMKEEELYLPIKQYFQEFGYSVDGEVGSLDILCEKNGQYIAVELKNDLNFKVFLQAAKQQKMFEHVFIGCWTPKNCRSRGFLDKIYLLQRLGLGLIFVSKRTQSVTVFCEPIVHSIEAYTSRNKRKKAVLLREFNARKTKSNLGGVHKKKLITAYKENSLLVLNYLYEHGPSKASDVKKAIGVENAYTILYRNHYTWFEKIDQGIYALSQNGKETYLKDYAFIVELVKIDQQRRCEEKNETV